MINLTPFISIQSLLLIVFNCFFSHWVNAQQGCLADITPPTIICKSILNIEVNDYLIPTEIIARSLDKGSFDNCTNANNLRFSFSENPTDSIFVLPILAGTRIRKYPLQIWIFDEQGTSSTCNTTLSVTYRFPCASILDTIPPYLDCDSLGISFLHQDTFELKAAYFNNYSFDDCTPPREIQFSWSPNTNDTLKKVTKSNLYELFTIYATDIVGNQSSRKAFLYNYFEYKININYFQDRNLNCVFDEGETVLLPEEISDTFRLSYGIKYNTNLSHLFDNSSTKSGWTPTSSYSYLFHQNNQIKLFDLNNLLGLNNIEYFTIGFSTNKGSIGYQPPFPSSFDSLFMEWGFTNGKPIITSSNFPSICDYEFAFFPDDFKDSTLNIDFPVFLPEADCPVMLVDIGTPFIRRCFDNTYTVQYCNYGLQTANDAYIDLSFDENLDLVSSEKEYELLGHQQIRIQLGDVPSAFCDRFQLIFKASCDAALGATHCVEAKIFPDTLCTPPTEDWSGAAIEVTGNCNGDSVQFQIKNIGAKDMLAPSKFIVIEDVILREEGEVQLLAQESMQFSLPANGSFYRMQADQVPNFPYPSAPMASIEGCGVDENGNPSFGFINQFTPNDFQLSTAMDCQQNRGAYDPNDKQVIPTGTGEQHFTEKNIPLNYKIRFQNTGTDTAFNIVIRDTLSSHLSPATLKMGSSSHPYDFLLLENNILVMRFHDIMLPDSAINEPASHGFIEFDLQQVKDLPDGTVIQNRAAIYFDFNEPIITNQVFNTIGIPFLRIINNVPNADFSDYRAVIMPNPLSHQAIIELKGAAMEGTVAIFNALGQPIRQLLLENNQVIFYRNQLASGVYFYRITNKNKQLILTGAMIIQGD